MKWILYGLGIWGFLLLLAFFFQRKLMYFPPNVKFSELEKEAESHGYIPWKSQDQSSVFGFTSPLDRNLGTIVFFHGNAEHVLDSHSLATGMNPQNNWNVALFEYPGYSKLPGSPSMHSIMSHAYQALSTLAEYRPLILIGRSIGTGIATALARQIQPDGIILISPFSRALDIANERYFFLLPSLLLQDRWDNIASLGYVNVPVLILHGKNDTTIPIRFGLKLYQSISSSKKFIEVSGMGHNDIPEPDASHEFWAQVYEFLLERQTRSSPLQTTSQK